jgi:hypothetical protein
MRYIKMSDKAKLWFIAGTFGLVLIGFLISHLSGGGAGGSGTNGCQSWNSCANTGVEDGGNYYPEDHPADRMP